MTLSLKPKVCFKTDKVIPRCWVTECRYTVAFCITDPANKKGTYQITAPRNQTPFAYTPRKEEVKRLIKVHKKEQERDS